MAVHKLMMALDKLYRVFYFEPNPAFPWLNTEYSLVRRNRAHAAPLCTPLIGSSDWRAIRLDRPT